MVARLPCYSKGGHHVTCDPTDGEAPLGQRIGAGSTGERRLWIPALYRAWPTRLPSRGFEERQVLQGDRERGVPIEVECVAQPDSLGDVPFILVADEIFDP